MKYEEFTALMDSKGARGKCPICEANNWVAMGSPDAAPMILAKLQPGGGVTPEDVRRYAQGKAAEDTRRKVAQTAELSVSVARKVETVQDEVLAQIKREGGYAEESTLSAPEGGDRVARLTLRVPVPRTA